MKNRALAIYFALLFVLCSGIIVGAKLLGKQGMYLAQVYMLTPAMAAVVTRLFFYPPRFKDANLRLGGIKHYVRFWLASIAITALSFGLFTLLRGITWDFTGQVFLKKLTEQFAATGQDINETLPKGLTPRTMLVLYFFGGLTVFNVIPGVVTGFGEEFGHRGFMFPLLYRIRPWVGIVIGGLIWYAWHLPLTLVLPHTTEYPRWQSLLNSIILAIGSVCTFTYLAYVYVKSRSVWVTSVAHIAMNNSAASFSYFVVVRNQMLANLGLTLTMVLVVALLFYRKELAVFRSIVDGGTIGFEFRDADTRP